MASVKNSSNENGALAGVSGSKAVQEARRAASDIYYVAKKLLRSTVNAAWIAGTTFVIVGIPWLVLTEQEQLLNDLELQQATLYGSAPQV